MTHRDAFLVELDAAAKDSSPSSAFLTVGGAHAIAAVVEEFYNRLLADPVTAPFFAPLVESDQLATLKRHQVLMLTKVLGGPDRYTGRDLRDGHAELGITDDIYRRVSLYLLTVMHDFKVPMNILLAADEVLRGVHPMIVTAPQRAAGTAQ